MPAPSAVGPNSPLDKRNALNEELVAALLTEITAAQGESTDLVVLRGEGQGFSAGFDLGGLEGQSDGDLLHRFVRIEQLLQAVHTAPFATLALAHGRVFGAGADLVCACSHRVAAPGTRFRFPGLAFGIVLGTRRLAGRVGADTARAIQAGGRTLDAAEAERTGLITAIADTPEWSEVVKTVEAEAGGITSTARAVFHRALADARPDEDMAHLVRTAAQPGLRDRISQYVGGGKR
ncbi:enoyl-CoA hydratase/isomerase family protein [Amycolatopsis alkalitolerans]|uniref:Enoyl-CoA hydratase/isomerase family protein n=1 Tax=Amycolatopsis alkalitolerans TaxID=2547244 RepID=A0A5C4M827_9PSEU|nr:enoyl-CoA hydratase/isomerase family protein [Amycolatopsis alkalitolerans]TNC27819.1 enoyl-CoA hydratase/isomerase family protein [Amycolatopsis alkalitolerans]